MNLSTLRVRRVRRALGILGVGTVASLGSLGLASGSLGADPTRIVTTSLGAADSVVADSERVVLEDSLFGLSGKLHMRFLAKAASDLNIPILSQLLGDSSARETDVEGVYRVESGARRIAFVEMIPFAAKKNGRIGTYRIGSWPGERGAGSDQYGNPEGFIAVTPDNQDEQVSEHFRLRDFLTKDQRDVWPKYLVLDLKLIDKLELVIDELRSSGVPVTRMSVMSGFRTPQYNANGGNTAGRATLSRHMYGDAADVFVDNDGNGRMDDLNGDGRVDHRDAQVIHAAAERVEKKYPQLLGGVGVYKATAAHGPFAHVDVRGSRARWGLL